MLVGTPLNNVGLGKWKTLKKGMPQDPTENSDI